jgi:hypothetical protein
MTEREKALAAYFATIMTDPRVRAAGFSPARLKDAILACIGEDVPAVLREAARVGLVKVAPAAGDAARGVLGTVLGGTVSEETQAAAMKDVGRAVETAFGWLDGVLAGVGKKRAGGKSA